ncbi:MAG: hypothetical protein JO353_07430, partial [Phycisphaerae bacterium]|nr:hypothetical protein [Phycisphaerae bacterium]
MHKLVNIMVSARALLTILLVATYAIAFTNQCVGAADQQTEAAPRELVHINATVSNGFLHPGIGLTAPILENARKQVLARREPWYSGYQALAADPNSAKSITLANESRSDPSKPAVDAFDSRAVCDKLQRDAAKAKRQALMYFFTGDEVYRANALRIVHIWSQMDPKKYKFFPEANIHPSYPMQDLIVAAELLRYTAAPSEQLTWSDKDTKDFTENFVVPALGTFSNKNVWFLNQEGYPLAASMSGDIFKNDRESYERRVEWFTVNKTAPNKGSTFSIQYLARQVSTDASTGQRVDPPVIEVVEMGRDQAHAGDDMEIFTNVARMMNGQGTKVDPITGTVSTAKDAVGPYEFLDDRILAATDYFCRFMLGYDTKWIPTPIDIAPNGAIRAIYPRIADNYRGRIREFQFWDLYYYYTCVKPTDVAKKAPYFYEAFTKRIVSSDTDWIFTPANATGEGLKVPPRVEEPPIVEVALRSTLLDPNASVVNDHEKAFVRLKPTEAGTRIAILSSDTDKKTIGLRIRTTGSSELKMSGLENPWRLPDTKGEWRNIAYTMSRFERFHDMEFFSFKGTGETRIDLESLIRDVDDKLASLAFRDGTGQVQTVAYIGAPIALDFSAASAGANLSLSSPDLPPEAKLDARTGSFSWTPTHEGKYTFIVSLTNGDDVAAKRVDIQVAHDRDAAVRSVTSPFNKDITYVRATFDRFQKALADLKSLSAKSDDRIFYSKLMQLQEATNALQPLTPLLPDGSMDYPKIVATSTIGDSLGLLTDGNNDTFPVYTLAKDLNYVFDFGPSYKISVSAFAIQGRLNFEDRAQDTAFFGSNDGKAWTQLTTPISERPVELTKIPVKETQNHDRVRYLKIEKTSRKSSPLFEPSELRIYGQRY